ncbi:1-acyl-sn-glycerol-3-phosphate acyltransferase [Microbacterium caowuchunii]|uniref:1-acyl-sn-glycerol-3-phosphate acyltransferase n=1 Tax=Microbacterium caowuchunii TaxID=2614638 RepID=A0A5J6KS68_9MICO|nr:lysophospholipid acyltransferase family protein [Microbacterium caowuchunii]KAA9130017.1 1-acyl-sn-glycerol-3-phosphate acyltransferase [Microbacterium caowuchunii]QEW00498.1 1-acyl-sn-glycerol-3-phosphate acyltransferase [Microbacterium caowuchunii]
MHGAECERLYLRGVTSAESPESERAARDPESVATDPVADVGFTYLMGRYVLAPLARLAYRPRIEGRANVPRKGPVIFASNHLSFIDSFVIPMSSPRHVQFLAKSSYFDGPGIKGWLSREFFTALGASPVQRGAGQAALDALDQQRRMLEAGKAIALYPEGTRSLDGRLYKGRTGVAFLALQTGAPVVPVGLIGTNEIMPVGAKFPRLRPRVTIRFGKPIDVSAHGVASSGRARRLATDEIMAAIHALSEQELAGVYNEVPAQNPIERIKQVLPHERR